MLMPVVEDSELEKLSSRGFTMERLIVDGVHTRIYLFYKNDPTGVGNKPLACKVADIDKMPKTVVVKFFVREIELLSKISHPNIITIHSIFQLNNKYFIFMRYAELGDLGGYISSKGYVKEKQVRAWTRQLAAALLYLHTLAVAHRDVKCDNILITRNMNVKLTDFGFSRHIVDKKGKEVHSGTFCGSLGYAAPEVIRGTRYYPRVADFWSLGCVIFAMLNGYLPFKVESPARLYADQVTKNYYFRRDIIMSSGVKEIVGWLLDPEPSNRLSLDGLLRSRWIRSIPKYRQLTDKELEAMDLAMKARKDMDKMREAHMNASSTAIDT